ncbi:hypothetical protein V493_00307, partial [Pseudogymnoascus sp. VKM F-4281 (FW-2241)]
IFKSSVIGSSNGNANIVPSSSKVLAAGADPSILSKDNRSALHVACRDRKTGVVYLLASKLRQDVIDKQDSSGRTALHDACTSGQPESVYRLLKSGANINYKNYKGRTPLHACAEYPLEQSLSLLQEHSKNVYGNCSSDQYRPVLSSDHPAWYKSNYETNPHLSDQDSSRIAVVVKELLMAGADVNEFDKNGQTPLDLSLLFDCREMLSALRSAHPDIKCQKLERRSPNLKMLKLLVQKCNIDINARSREHQYRYSSYESNYGDLESKGLHWLASADSFWQLEGIQYLVEKGADINPTNEKAQTPLYIAAAGTTENNIGSYEGVWRSQCVDLLLGLGADSNIVAKNGLTPLHKAESSADITRSLLGAGADLSAGKTSPIFNAIMAQNAEVLTAILDAGGDVNAVADSITIKPSVTDQARTALFCASFTLGLNRHMPDSIPQIKLIINRGADMYAPLNDRETLIHYLFEHGEYEAICAYLDCHDKINFDARDQLGRTIILAACNWTGVAPGYNHKHWFAKESPLVMRLLEYGANMMAVSNDGRNALHYLLDNPDIEQDTIMQVLEKEPEACKKMLNHKDNEGYTPFHIALRVLRPEVCFRLLDLGAGLIDPDPTGATALHHIASQYLQQHRPQRGQDLQQKHLDGHHEKVLKLWNFVSATGAGELCVLVSEFAVVPCEVPMSRA